MGGGYQESRKGVAIRAVPPPRTSRQGERSAGPVDYRELGQEAEGSDSRHGEERAEAVFASTWACEWI